MSDRTFSIVIPSFNREKEVGRAIRSGLSQMSDDGEIIVVDDCSTDRSVEAVRPFLKDPRVRLVENTTNQGEWGARAAGIAAASGEWIILLDSDDEIMPGGLASILAGIRSHGKSLERLGFGYLCDNGTHTPFPEASEPTVLDFAGYVKWYAHSSRSDALWVTRRETFATVPVPAGRSDHGRPEALCATLLYTFRFHSVYRSMLLPALAGAVHLDSANRQTTATLVYGEEALARAREEAVIFETLLAKYGSRILQIEPALHFQFSRARLTTLLLGGDRRAAFGEWKSMLQHHRHANSLVLGLLIAIGPTNAYRLRERHRQRRNDRVSTSAA